jgi:hypothetical protein
MAGKELVPIVDAYPALAGDAAGVIETMRENLGNAKLSAFNLDRIKMPSGGGIAWEVQTLEGPSPEKALTGIIVYHRDVRTFWRSEYSGEGNPPDCSSDDGLHGFGDPGGDCSACPFAQFDSGRNGGQACKQQKQVFLLMGDSMLPAVVNLPPTSLRPYRDFMLRLGSARILYRHVEVRIGLDKVQGGNVPDYSRATIAMTRRLNESEALLVDGYHSMISDIVAATPVERSAGRDHEPEPEPEPKPKRARGKAAQPAQAADGQPDF